MLAVDIWKPPVEEMHTSPSGSTPGSTQASTAVPSAKHSARLLSSAGASASCPEDVGVSFEAAQAPAPEAALAEAVMTKLFTLGDRPAVAASCCDVLDCAIQAEQGLLPRPRFLKFGAAVAPEDAAGGDAAGGGDGAEDNDRKLLREPSSMTQLVFTGSCPPSTSSSDVCPQLPVLFALNSRVLFALNSQCCLPSYPSAVHPQLLTHTTHYHCSAFLVLLSHSRSDRPSLFGGAWLGAQGGRRKEQRPAAEEGCGQG
jgi:hypothetical protein